MIAGGLGGIDAGPDEEDRVPGRHAADPAGGPGMRIGHGGGAASSMATGVAADLDFDSVQRGNPEIERRAQR